METKGLLFLKITELKFHCQQIRLTNNGKDKENESAAKELEEKETEGGKEQEREIQRILVSEKEN